MAAVKSGDTTPEMAVRRLVHRLGYRFRLHRRDLPGTPDIVLPRLGKIINVHGCFWHVHTCQRRRKAPVKNAGYWNAKRRGNVARDRRVVRRLRRLGWRVLVVWECQTRAKKRAALVERVLAFLENGGQVAGSRRISPTSKRPPEANRTRSGS